jgi:hypothetical protein
MWKTKTRQPAANTTAVSLRLGSTCDISPACR